MIIVKEQTIGSRYIYVYYKFPSAVVLDLFSAFYLPYYVIMLVHMTISQNTPTGTNT